MRQNNIFYNVIKNETSLTEVFCNLLSYKAFRDLFLNMLKERNGNFNISNIHYKNFDTEIFLKGNKGRSDLHLNANDTEYIFEIKIIKYRDLTDNQPKGYLEYLKNDEDNNENHRLFFIIPRGYLHINKICKNWNDATGYERDDVLNNNLIFWEDILEKIKKNELDKLNLIINEFCKIIEKNWLTYKDVTFSKFEIDLIFNRNKIEERLEMLLNLNIPKIINKLFEIVDQVYEKFQIDNSSDEQGADCYGYSLKNKEYEIPEKWDVWFGVDYEIWEKHNFPLSVQLFSDDDNEWQKILSINLLEKFEYENKQLDKTTFIGLEKEVFEKEDKNIIEELEKKIFYVIEKINSAK